MFTYPVDDDITLHYPQEDHAEALYALIDSNRDHIDAYLDLAYHFQSAAQMRGWLAGQRAAFVLDDRLTATIVYRGEVAGQVSLTIKDRAGDIGYWLGEGFTRRGIATRAVRALVDHAFGDLVLRRITIRCSASNPASQGIPERLGFTREMTQRDGAFLHGEPDDIILYALLVSDWRIQHDAPYFAHHLTPERELRLLELRHAPWLYALHENSYETLRQWLPWVESHRSLTATRSLVERGLKLYGDGHGFWTGIWVKGRLAGAVIFHHWDAGNRKAQLGYWLGDRFTGQGIMTQAVRAVVDCGFRQYGLNRIEIYCATGNVKSCAIPERLGFRHEAILREAEWLVPELVSPYARPNDWHLYGMLAMDWR